MKPLYGVSKAGNYSFATYYGHHIKKLDIHLSIYDSYLLYNHAFLTIVSLQIGNILFLAGSQFAIKKEERIRKAYSISKNWEYLLVKRSIKFNREIV